MTYAALWNHSHYSILDSTMSVDDLIAAAVEMEMPAIGLTDRNSVAGAVQFYKKAKAAGLHPVIGAEVKPAARPIASSPKTAAATPASASSSPMERPSNPSPPTRKALSASRRRRKTSPNTAKSTAAI